MNEFREKAAKGNFDEIHCATKTVNLSQYLMQMKNKHALQFSSLAGLFKDLKKSCLQRGLKS